MIRTRSQARSGSRRAVAQLVDRMLIESGVTAAVVALRLNVTRAAVSHYRHAKRPITFDVLEEIADACGYSVRLTLTPQRGHDNLVDAVTLAVDGEPSTVETALNTRQVDALGRPWLRTEEGWAPTRGNPLRIRLPWVVLQRLYGPTHPLRPPLRPRGDIS